MNTIQNNDENEKISKKEVFIELFKLGFPFLIIVLVYIFFVA
jgi:hypothetical protein